MRKPIVATTALAVALLIMQALPAAAVTSVRAAPYEQKILGYGTCTVVAEFGNYGVPYARITERPGSRCHFNTGVRVASAPGPYYSPWCTHYMRLSNPYPYNCNFSGFTSTATMPSGTAVEAGVYLCYEYSLGVTCNEFKVNPWA